MTSLDPRQTHDGTWFVPLLDHGFVELLDTMGDDRRCVAAARVSLRRDQLSLTEGDAAQIERDQGLIARLIKDRHTSPFEHAMFQFRVRAPIFVVRQWVRHRFSCLAGDTQLYFDLPSSIEQGRVQVSKMRLDKLSRLWNEGSQLRTPKKKPAYLERIDVHARYSIPELSRLVDRREETLRNLVREGGLVAERVRGAGPSEPSIFVRGSDWTAFALSERSVNISHRRTLGARQLRCLDESSGQIVHTRITDVWESGVKPVFKVTLANGYHLTMSKDHLCLTDRGWLTLEQATGLRLGPTGATTWRDDSPLFAANGLPLHQSKEWLADQRSTDRSVSEIAENAGVSYHTIRKWLRNHGLEFSSKERGALSGRSQRGQRRQFSRRPISAEGLANIRQARSGTQSNFWKGGVASERASIGRWTTDHAAAVHQHCGHRCAICQQSGKLHAHHVDPVWHNAARALDIENLTSLCDTCHRRLHANDLELEFLADVGSQLGLSGFFERHPARQVLDRKPRPRPTRLCRQFVPLAKIEYVGEEMTYDVAVEGPHHNFVANGFIVHNSFNEESGRYVKLDDEFCVPESFRVRIGKAMDYQYADLPPDENAAMQAEVNAHYEVARALYESLLQRGVAREHARMVLPVAQYTTFFWTVNALALMNFLNLRNSPHAQAEIQAYASVIEDMFRERMPWTHAAFREHWGPSAIN